MHHDTIRSARNQYNPPIDAVRLEGALGERCLYGAGDLSLLERACVAVVGARASSREGKGLAMQVANEVVAAGKVIVSGLAAGIDTAAHCAAAPRSDP